MDELGVASIAIRSSESESARMEIAGGQPVS
jgi:hypothetical protein